MDARISLLRTTSHPVDASEPRFAGRCTLQQAIQLALFRTDIRLECRTIAQSGLWLIRHTQIANGRAHDLTKRWMHTAMPLVSITKNCFSSRVGFQYTTLDINNQHCIEGRLNESMRPRFNALKLLATAECFGNIPEDTLRPQSFRVNRAAVLFEPACKLRFRPIAAYARCRRRSCLRA